MNWETRWMRRLIKGAIWAACLIALCLLLEITPTWQIFLLCAVLSVVDVILDDLLPSVRQKNHV